MTDNNGQTWSLLQILLASDEAISDEFGYDVAVYSDTIVVGALLDDNERGTDAGREVNLYF